MKKGEYSKINPIKIFLFIIFVFFFTGHIKAEASVQLEFAESAGATYRAPMSLNIAKVLEVDKTKDHWTWEDENGNDYYLEKYLEKKVMCDDGDSWYNSGSEDWAGCLIIAKVDDKNDSIHETRVNTALSEIKKFLSETKVIPGSNLALANKRGLGRLSGSSQIAFIYGIQSLGEPSKNAKNSVYSWFEFFKDLIKGGYSEKLDEFLVNNPNITESDPVVKEIRKILGEEGVIKLISIPGFEHLFEGLRKHAGGEFEIFDILLGMTTNAKLTLYQHFTKIVDATTTNSAIDSVIKNENYKELRELVKDFSIQAKEGLDDDVINTGVIKFNANGYGTAIGSFGLDLWTSHVPTNAQMGEDGKIVPAQCNATSYSAVLTAGSECSLVAYLINSLLSGIYEMLAIFVSWAGVLFDWIMQIGVYGFSDWVTNSGAYDIWRKIILALVTSLLLPLIFYLIIRMLIDNDTSNIEKVLPKILFTALFVYFSFTIVGWIIDQSNILTIYTYRSMTGGGTQPISDILEKLLLPTTTAINSKGDWLSTPLYILRIIITSVSLMVIFQGAILIFARTVTLLLAMIFSPLMLMPVGIHSLIDKYRDMVIKYFSNGVLLGPIFMFLLLLGIQVGDVAGNIVGTNSADVLNSAAGAGSGVLSAAITSVLVIIVLQLAITVAKNLSGELGTLLSQKVSAFTGGLALGGTGSALRNTVGRFAMKAQEKGWMKGKEGSARHKMMTKLYGNLGKSTFDVRGTKAFKAAAGTSLGKNIGLGDLGKSSTSTAKTRFDRKLASEAAYHNTLSDDGKDRNIKRLKNPLLSVFGTRYRTDIANKLNKKNKRKQNTNTATTNSGVVGATQNTSQNSNLAGSSTVGANSAVGQNSTQVSPPSPSTIAPNNIPNSQSDRNIGASPEGPSGPGKDSSSRYSDSPSPVRQEENSIPPMPSSKSLSQHRLKERLREKYGTHERMEDGKIVRRFDQQLLDNRRRDLKTTQRNIEREEENKYQDNVLREAKEKDKKTNLVNSNTSSTSSSSTVDSQSIQINYPNNGAKIIDIDDKKANNIDEDNIRA